MIEVGDIVRVDFNGAQFTLSHKAVVIHVPCELGDSWVFEDLQSNKKHYVSEGCTITILETKEDRENDLDKLKELMDSFGIGYMVSPTKKYLVCKQGCEKITGHSNLFTNFEFDNDGNFIGIGIWEE
jgi:hypothetical protein